MREVPNAPLPSPPDPTLPWRLVVMGSDPLLQEVRDPQTGLLADYAPLSRLRVVQELDLLRDDLARQNPQVPIRWQRIAPTRQALTDDLVASEPILFHYTGHGDVVNGTPVLCFDDGAGCMDAQPVADLAALLRGSAYFAFLNACRTADSHEPGANLALALVKQGVPVVLGTQYHVLDEAAAHFARTFYRVLAAGNHPAQALYRARLKLKDQLRSEPREWAVPVLYYAQGYVWPTQKPTLPAALSPLEPPRPNTEQLRAPDPTAGYFVGRQHELVELARLFIHDQRRIVTVRGTGGIGKTTLVNALAQRLRFHFHDGIVAISLFLPGDNTLLRAATVRKTLAELLGIRDQAFDVPEAIEKQERVLVEAARSRPRLLLIWDNYETVLWRLGREVSDTDSVPFTDEQRQEAAAVQRLVRRLADAGVHLLFTTRQSPVGLAGEAFYPPAEQGHQLKGLRLADSVTLMRQHVGERIPSQAFLEELAAAVEYHPLAMTLAAARWAKSQDDETTFLANLRDELAKAHDPAAPMYQQSSLEINVRISLNALPADLQANLLALTIIANPVITPSHGAVIWGLEDEAAHQRLELLHQASLLQGHGYDEQRNRALTYSVQPVIASVLGRLAQEHDLGPARTRYAAWVAQLVKLAYSRIDTDPDVAALTQFLLPDIAAALPYLPTDQRGWCAWRAASIFSQLGQPVQAEQCIGLAEAVAKETADQPLLSRVFHQQATLLVIRGDLDGALRLYEESLALCERLGDVQGKSATLIMMAQVQFIQGEHAKALANVRAGWQLLQAIGAAPDAAQAAQLVQQMEAMLASVGTPSRLVGALIAAVVRAKRGQMSATEVRAELERLLAEEALAPVVTALVAALADQADAAAQLLLAAEPLLTKGTAAERADALMGIGHLANVLGDQVTELRAREAAVAAFRMAGDDRQSLVNLSIALYDLAMFHVGQGDFATAVPLPEEVVELDERTGHPDLASDRATLEEVRRRAAGVPEPTIREAIIAWRDGGRDDWQFVALLTKICNHYVQTMRTGDRTSRWELAHDLAVLRAIQPLPIAGTNDFLHVLQLRLRDEPGMAERAAQIQAALPTQLALLLTVIEQQVRGEAVTLPAATEVQALAEQVAVLLSQLTPAQQAELLVLAQVAPLVQLGAQLLRQPELTAAERSQFAERLDQAADQAEAGEVDGSP
ncbi:CHAT domain-containing protein [uncultured Chloroflexus sp.]|uniref:CHAT domain-containing protein n=1 Tax=uncultured Chloroflexus sp. TaxID=214040 RepID=UPI0026033A5B|nr:CHAT domain-containing protein [uncultured Chloroflexus sp.]